MTRVRSDESGLTIVEAMVAGLLVIIGGLATLQVFDASARNNFRAEESQVIVNRLQAELEELRDLPFDALAMSANPGSSADDNDPRWRVTGDSYLIGRDGTNPRPMVIDAAKGFSPGPEPFQSGDVSGEIWKFVVWAPDPDCPNLGGCQDLKRVIVAAKLNEAPASFERAFQEVQGEVSSPDAAPPDNVNPPPEGGSGVNAEGVFWLTDTPCSFSTRQPITADHPGHNARARCIDGPQTGSTRGAPDLMFSEAPPLDPNYPPDGQPLYDYATDSEPAVGAEPDKGLLMPTSSLDSCVLEPALGLSNVRLAVENNLPPLSEPPGELDGLLDLLNGDPNKQLRVHTWLSPKVSGSGGELIGDGRLELWTKTMDDPNLPGELGVSHPGEICVEVFVRQTVQVPVKPPDQPLFYVEREVDLPVVNSSNLVGGEDLRDPALTHFRYPRNPWPQQWSEITVPLEFVGVDSTGTSVPVTVPQGSQIGMTLIVPDAGTQPGTGLEFMYDHPSFESRLHLTTEPAIAFSG